VQQIPARRSLTALALASTALVAGLAPPAASAAAKPPKITVMSRNLFLGADLIPLVPAKPGAEFEHAAGQVFAQVESTEAEARMKLVAGEIASAKPDLVGLQEVTLWRTGPKDDPAPSTDVQIDYLASLMSALKASGASYRVVADQRTLDLEGPTDRGFDIRFTDGNVILARKGVKVSHSRSADFKSQLKIPTAAVGTISVNRSFNQLDAVVGKAKLHFVNAHLEAYSPEFRLKQAKELVKGPLKQKKIPTVLVGDLNSGPKLPKAEDRPPYRAIAAAGYKEARTPKFNCCFNDDLVTGPWDHIVDHIMTRPKFTVVKSFVTGFTNKTPGGKAPSDHGGVVSVLRLPKAKKR
jgi:endonuclease/exonuclease/phosphatase family metal-dependent hydrolase